MITAEARLASHLRAARKALSAAEWTRIGGMVATVAGLYVLGFLLLLSSVSHHYHVSRTDIFGVGTGILALTLACGTPSTPTTSRRSTTRRAIDGRGKRR